MRQRAERGVPAASASHLLDPHVMHMTDTNSRPDSGTSSAEQRDRLKSTTGGSPTPRERGDGQLTGVNQWGQRAVHFLMVFIPAVLIGGIILEWLGLATQATEYAPVVVGVVITVAGVLAVVMILYNLFRRSRQTELTEFLSFRD